MASSLLFDKLKHINENTRHLVFGYLRRIGKQCSNDHSSPLIENLCLLFYCAFLESSILTPKENQTLEALLSTNEIFAKINTSEWKLLLQGTKNGFRTHAFNAALRNQKNVLSIIHTSDDNIFGGFLNEGFDGGELYEYTNDGGKISEYTNDPNAFLFLIRSSKGYKPGIFPIKKYHTDRAAHLASRYFCRFGLAGWNISLCDCCDTKLDSWVDWEANWANGAYETPSKFYLNGGISKFLVKDYEIFTPTPM